MLSNVTIYSYTTRNENDVHEVTVRYNRTFWQKLRGKPATEKVFETYALHHSWYHKGNAYKFCSDYENALCRRVVDNIKGLTQD